MWVGRRRQSLFRNGPLRFLGFSPRLNLVGNFPYMVLGQPGAALFRVVASAPFKLLKEAGHADRPKFAGEDFETGEPNLLERLDVCAYFNSWSISVSHVKGFATRTWSWSFTLPARRRKRSSVVSMTSASPRSAEAMCKASIGRKPNDSEMFRTFNVSLRDGHYCMRGERQLADTRGSLRVRRLCDLKRDRVAADPHPVSCLKPTDNEEDGLQFQTNPTL